MDSIHIRPATINDLLAVATVQVTAWKETYRQLLPQTLLDKDTIEERLKMWRGAFGLDGHHLWVGVLEREVVAFVSFGKSRQADRAGEVYAIYAFKKAHGLGLGRRLFQQAKRTLAKDGYTELYLTVLDKNPTIGFYKHMGGEIFEPTTMTIEGVTVNEWIMRFPINSFHS